MRRVVDSTRTTALVVTMLPLLGGAAVADVFDSVPPLTQLVEVETRTAEVVRHQIELTQSSVPTAPSDSTTPRSDSALAATARPAEPLVDETERPVPVALSIPDIAVTGPVETVGLGPNSILDVPRPDRGGWYEHSAAPGDRGATVIAAHADLNGSEALFFDLRSLRAGDEITVDLSDGSSARYVVESVALYDKQDLPQTSLFRNQGDHALHLITCGGSFDRTLRSYRGNTVVVAMPITA